MSRPVDPAAEAGRILQQSAQAVSAYLNAWLDRCESAPPRLIESMRYSLMAGGKRLRPALVLECHKACEKQPSPTLQKTALAAAGALELIHTFSLVHDDLPAMDDDDFRRGRPTNHKVFGEAMAILAGDAMVTLAFELIAADATAVLAPSLIRELAFATGAQGMIGGQVLDMQSESKGIALPELQRLHRMKTGALLLASCRMGAIAAGADEEILAAVDRYGRHLGLAFQIVDDVLDVTATAEQMGKATGKDAARGKQTYPSLMGLDASRREAAQQLSAALDAVEVLGSKGEGLRSLAIFVVERTL